MNNKRILILAGIIACWVFFILEVSTDIWFGRQFPGYDWVTESLSYLGQAGSPVERGVAIWGIGFSFLLTLFALAFYQVYKDRKWAFAGMILLIMYALGEGIGSGLFPINPPGTTETTAAWLHNFFSGIGDTGLVLFPFLLMLLFSKESRIYHWYLWSVVGVGLLMATFFLVAKYYQPDNFTLHYKGVWQRIYQLNYHINLLVLSVKMIPSLANFRSGFPASTKAFND